MEPRTSTMVASAHFRPGGEAAPIPRKHPFDAIIACGGGERLAILGAPQKWGSPPAYLQGSASRFAGGGGIVGLATAYGLGQRFPGARIVLLEKEDGVGRHQTGHNSGVLHCGLYYKPGSVKARLAVSGIRQMVAFCQENGVPHEVCGKLVVAADEANCRGSAALLERGAANGLEGLRWLTPRGDARNRAARGRRGGPARPQEGIVDYPAGVRRAGGEDRAQRRARGDRRARRRCAAGRRGGWRRRRPARSKPIS